ncbi:hypothetical protein NDI56_03955 [Haloarcula sp. S1CR25-12]|uniref:Uncharacterized protein n=1 Tax=Haloarcula saliterrae TaxID=2950534 RepID=A0ABU2F8J7_9EURY|nr:hypothetical protein [Haloarcula sp. S1CR25-12]MDS0258564.1 hypothetical protein [Haloarcula sp. S1CR25-12]
MIVRYARARYVDAGGDPRAFDDMLWGEVLDWLAIHDVLDARQSLGSIPEE